MQWRYFHVFHTYTCYYFCINWSAILFPYFRDTKLIYNQLITSSFIILSNWFLVCFAYVTVFIVYRRLTFRCEFALCLYFVLYNSILVHIVFLYLVLYYNSMFYIIVIIPSRTYCSPVVYSMLILYILHFTYHRHA